MPQLTAVPTDVIIGFVTHSINEILTSYQENRTDPEYPTDFGCCARCCAPCNALWMLRQHTGDNALDGIMATADPGMNIPGYDWWDADLGGIRWELIDNAWNGANHGSFSGDAHIVPVKD